MQKSAFERTGLVPRSIIRTFDRFRRQLLPGAEDLVIQEFRVSKYQVLVSVRCLASLLIFPLLVNYLVKTTILVPLAEYIWNTQQNEIFLNFYQENRAFLEMRDFEEKTFFESLLSVEPRQSDYNTLVLHKTQNDFELIPSKFSKMITFHQVFNEDSLRKSWFLPSKNLEMDFGNQKKEATFKNSLLSFENKKTNKIDDILLQKKFQEKTIELAAFYNQQTISAIANVFGDFVTLITIAFLFVLMKPQIIILKSFLTESIYSLSDTTKSFLLILLTDLLVGFHSPRGWEILIEILLRHFGLPENQDFVFLFVATLPVLLDTVFKYWIFRYLNQISPSTVATYHSMIE